MSRRTLAVMPARGGSKRLPGKNIRLFHGRPMLTWALAAAHASRLFDHIIVSTDDEAVASVARAAGAEVPFVRPPELSDDHTGVTAVMAHAVTWAQAHGWAPDDVCCVYATAPFLRADDIRAGLTALRSGNWAFALAVTTFAAPIQRAFRAHPDGGLEMFDPGAFATRSQDLPEAWHDAALFCWGTSRAWTDGLRVFDRQTVPVPVPRWRVQDIDTDDDWRRAELLAPLLLDAAGGDETR